MELDMEQASARLRTLAEDKYLMHDISECIEECIQEMEDTRKDIFWYEAHAIDERRQKNGEN